MSAHSEKIGAEEIKCKEMADNAQRDLDEALPALEEAMKVSSFLLDVFLQDLNDLFESSACNAA